MRFRVEQSQGGRWSVLLDGTEEPISNHDSEREARERLDAYEQSAIAASAPTAETGVARGERTDLPDGSQVIVRQIEPEDAPLLLEGFEKRFGDDSRYQRFLAPKKGLSPSELAYFTDVDHDGHEAIGALDPESGEGLAIARFVRDRQRHASAEAAVAVGDDWQGRGLGGVLLDRLAERARELGVEEFTASLLTSNRAMLALFAKLGRMQVRQEGAGMRLNVHLSTDPEEGCLRDALRAAAAGEVSA